MKRKYLLFFLRKAFRITDEKPNFSLYSPCYAKACNEFTMANSASKRQARCCSGRR